MQKPLWTIKLETSGFLDSSVCHLSDVKLALDMIALWPVPKSTTKRDSVASRFAIALGIYDVAGLVILRSRDRIYDRLAIRAYVIVPRIHRKCEGLLFPAIPPSDAHFISAPLACSLTLF